jgi:tRNA threonylcarbamoyladenosine biosynthesis protein TsaE
VRQPLETATRDALATEALATSLARAIPSLRDSPASVHLTGGLGSGKTTFARGVLRGLGMGGTVRSPSYTLLETYETRGLVIVHVDLYRLEDPGELEPLGLRELHRAGHLWLIEWPERAAGRVPAADITVALTFGAGEHRLRFEASSPLGQNWLENFTAG